MSDEDNITIRSKDFTKSEIKIIGDLYKQTTQSHDDCDGTGAVLSSGGDGAVDCECTYSFRYLRELVYSRIPKKFWELDLSIPFTRFLSENLSLVSSGGSIHGMPGQGKTRFLSYLGKYFIKEKKQVIYFSAFDLEYLVKNESEEDSVIYMERLMGSDILLVDEIENFEFGKDFWVSKKIERLLNKFHDAGGSIYFTTSYPNLHELGELNFGLGRICTKIANENSAILSKTKINFVVTSNFLKKSFIEEAKSCQ